MEITEKAASSRDGAWIYDITYRRRYYQAIIYREKMLFGIRDGYKVVVLRSRWRRPLGRLLTWLYPRYVALTWDQRSYRSPDNALTAARRHIQSG